MPSRRHNKRVPSSSKTLDPFRRLTTGTFHISCNLYAIPSIIFLREVSKEWNDAICELLSRCPECYSVLDFRSCPHGRIIPNLSSLS
ncbi:uncharacterized protein V1513DRAFT_449606 [Lipomyces chichibuensis]|uniref:uncharacterized protein n=1 Tax=Lipomyces chichibuensis TaxID=1546026 RepID=UPI0033432AA7